MKSPKPGSKPSRAAAPKKAKSRAAAAPKRRTRMSPEDRSEQIVKGAIAFFAERGFGGQTRELASRIGVTQGLLYRYFPTKDHLIEKVYEELFVKRFKAEWQRDLFDRGRPLIDRLSAFYLNYSTVLHDYEWGRIYLFSGLEGATIAKRFVSQITHGVFRSVIGELRHEFGLPSLSEAPVSEMELELMWSLHGSIFYIGIRAWVYGAAVPSDIPGAVLQLVRNFVQNAETAMREQHRTLA